MSLTPGTEGDAGFENSPAGRDGPLPQGLKSYPKLPNPDCPDLGFDPAPGSTEIVADLRGKLDAGAKVLEQTHERVVKLMDGSYWEGDGAVAFREQLQDGPLPRDLRNAARSIRKASHQLRLWEGELEEFQRRAKKLNGEAKEARAAVDAAKERAGAAKGDPDLDRKGGRQDLAEKDLGRANAAVRDAEDELERVIGRAHSLAGEHEEQARTRAAKIRAATDKLAPHKPGLFDRALAWVKENLPDILSGLAGVLGVIALFALTGGTAAVFLLIATAAVSASALLLRLSDPKVRASLVDGFTKGEFDADFWANSVSVGTDFVGALPGLGAVGKGISGMRGPGLSLGQRMSGFGRQTMNTARDLTSIGNPMLNWAVESAPQLERALRTTEKVAPWAGVATAGYGLAGSLVEELQSDTGKSAGTVIDGSALGLIGIGQGVDLATRLFRP